ncbi:hypothetical protein Ancab_014059 [Ancistrocladus abbreviatus]
MFLKRTMLITDPIWNNKINQFQRAHERAELSARVANFCCCEHHYATKICMFGSNQTNGIEEKEFHIRFINVGTHCTRVMLSLHSSPPWRWFVHCVLKLSFLSLLDLALFQGKYLIFC